MSREQAHVNQTTANSGPRLEALYALAYRKLNEHNHADAGALLRLMLHVAPGDERAWLALGLCHERLGQLKLASELYAAGAMAARPSGRCALACARVLDRQGQSDSASELYVHAVEAFEATADHELATHCRDELEARP
jgi:tetratricopeptide (TPR) repeat protein